MTQKEQIVSLDNDLNRLIELYRQEFDLGVAAVVGVLQCKIFHIQYAAQMELEDED